MQILGGKRRVWAKFHLHEEKNVQHHPSEAVIIGEHDITLPLGIRHEAQV